MEIKLVKKVPEKDGYYLVRFTLMGGNHLVLIATELDGARVMYPDNPKSHPVIRLNIPHQTVLEEAYFSEEPIQITID